MKNTLENEPKIVPFENFAPVPQEIFGKLKRAEDCPIKSLLAWSGEESNSKILKQPKKSLQWVSESHDAFKCFTVLNPNMIRPSSAFEHKPISDAEERPAGVQENDEASPSQSPKANTAKTPKSGEKGTKRQLERIKKLNQTTR